MNVLQASRIAHAEAGVQVLQARAVWSLGRKVCLRGFRDIGTRKDIYHTQKGQFEGPSGLSLIDSRSEPTVKDLSDPTVTVGSERSYCPGWPRAGRLPHPSHGNPGSVASMVRSDWWGIWAGSLLRYLEMQQRWLRERLDRVVVSRNGFGLLQSKVGLYWIYLQDCVGWKSLQICWEYCLVLCRLR